MAHSAMPGVVRPAAVRPGDLIGVIAPAGAVDAESLAMGVARLEAAGFRIKRGRFLAETFRGMAGEDRKRAADCQEMFQDASVRAVICARGGYGSARLIPLLDSSAIRANPKVFVGSSDVTALLLFLTENCGLVSFHGPMVAPHLGRAGAEPAVEHLLRIVGAGETSLLDHRPVRIVRSGTAQGRLTGGCLSILCSTLGTGYEPRTDRAILFLEDTPEPAYRLDRMLTQLKQVGKFEGCEAVVFGSLGTASPAEAAGDLTAEIVQDVLADFKGPILMDIPAGHCEHPLTLPLGVKARLKVTGGPGPGGPERVRLDLEEPAVLA